MPPSLQGLAKFQPNRKWVHHYIDHYEKNEKELEFFIIVFHNILFNISSMVNMSVGPSSYRGEIWRVIIHYLEL